MTDLVASGNLWPNTRNRLPAGLPPCCVAVSAVVSDRDRRQPRCAMSISGSVEIRDRSQPGCSGPSLSKGFCWSCGISCGLGVKHQEKKCRDPTKRHTDQKERPLRRLKRTQSSLAHNVRHHCRYALHFCLHGKRDFVEIVSTPMPCPRCDADHEKPDSGCLSGDRAPAVVDNGRLPVDAVAG